MSVNQKYDATFFGLISRVSPWYQLKLSLKYFRRFFYKIWWFRGSDRGYTLNLLETALEEHLRVISSEGVEGFDEVEEFRIPKEEAIKRCLVILRNMDEDNYDERCGFDQNYEFYFTPVEGKEELSQLHTTATDEQNEHNRNVLKEAFALEQAEMDELCDILRNPDHGLKTWWK